MYLPLLTKPHSLSALGALIIALASALLYVPFLNNEIIFDDHGLFTSLAVFDYAQRPLDFSRRTFPYFTLGLVHVLTGSIAANRVVSLILHILCSWVLFALLSALVKQAMKTDAQTGMQEDQIVKRAQLLGLLGACWFAVNPVAVYGAGYLAQRTILFATLFSLLSLWFYRRSLSEDRTADIFTAALFYSAAVLSKEHAIMLPLAVVAMTPLYCKDKRLREHYKRIALFIVLCAPAGLTALLNAKSVVATSYEPDAVALLTQIQGTSWLNNPWGHWIISILMQANLFFDYPRYWLIPDVRSMSIDMRVDFSQIWSTWATLPKALLFFACPIISFSLLKRHGRSALFGMGLFYSWILFLTELASIRIQEPFVLYRSYIWAPGYVLMGTAILLSIQKKWLLTFSLPAFALYFFLGGERLTSMISEGEIWLDAAAKLQSEDMVGSDRIFYNRGLHYIRKKNYEEAIQDFSKVIARRNDIVQAFYYRGIAYYSTQDFLKAEIDFNHALHLDIKHAPTHYSKGLIFERLGCIEKAKNEFIISHGLGFSAAIIKLNSLEQLTLDKKLRCS